MKKLVQYIKSLLVVVLLICTVSCNEWLNLEPENKLVKQEFWQKKEDVAAVMAAMYDAYRDNVTALWMWGEIRADMSEISGTLSGYPSVAQSEILSTNVAINWDGFYNAINLANTIMTYSKDVLKIDDTLIRPLKNHTKPKPCLSVQNATSIWFVFGRKSR